MVESDIGAGHRSAITTESPVKATKEPVVILDLFPVFCPPMSFPLPFNMWAGPPCVFQASHYPHPLQYSAVPLWQILVSLCRVRHPERGGGTKPVSP